MGHFARDPTDLGRFVFPFRDSARQFFGQIVVHRSDESKSAHPLLFVAACDHSGEDIEHLDQPIRFGGFQCAFQLRLPHHLRALFLLAGYEVGPAHPDQGDDQRHQCEFDPALAFSHSRSPPWVRRRARRAEALRQPKGQRCIGRTGDRS